MTEVQSLRSRCSSGSSSSSSSIQGGWKLFSLLIFAYILLNSTVLVSAKWGETAKKSEVAKPPASNVQDQSQPAAEDVSVRSSRTRAKGGEPRTDDQERKEGGIEDFVEQTDGLWDVANEGRVRKLGVEPLDGNTYYFMDYAAMLEHLHPAEQQEVEEEDEEDHEALIFLPYYSEVLRFSLQDSGTMPPSLQAKYPEIKSYSGRSTGGDHPATSTVDINPAGLHAQIHGLQGTYYIDPVRGAKSAIKEGLILHHGYSVRPDAKEIGKNDNPLKH
mmetsp:Transcript_32287/g.45037  ORF Transcript_32287/g.45037 Transcript_32287/m.45037 type:complete len:274 (+) Transcript_32287:121-942(+)